MIKDSIQRKKNKCFVRGGHQGLRGTIHIKNQLHNPVAVFEMNVFANYKIVLRIFQDANEARRKRAMVSIKTIFHYLLFSYNEKKTHTQSFTLEADLSLISADCANQHYVISFYCWERIVVQSLAIVDANQIANTNKI